MDLPVEEIEVRGFFHSRTPTRDDPLLRNCTLTPMVVTSEACGAKVASSPIAAVKRPLRSITTSNDAPNKVLQGMLRKWRVSEVSR